MKYSQVNERAVDLAYAAYEHAKKLGCEEALAIGFAQNAHNHWLFALEQRSEKQLALLAGAVKGD